MNNYRPISKSIFALILLPLTILAIFTPRKTYAFAFSPIMAEFSMSGDGATRTFTAENPTDEKIAVQVVAFTRLIDSSGKETLVPSEHFKIFPEQFTLDPKASRAVRITYRGPTDLKSEIAYRFIAEQLPIELKSESEKKSENQAQMKFLIRYATAIYVAPTNVKPDVQLTARPATAESKPKKRMIELRLENKGSAHQILFPSTVQLTSKGKTITLENEALKDFEKQNLLPAGIRTFILPWPNGLPEGSVSGAIRFN